MKLLLLLFTSALAFSQISSIPAAGGGVTSITGTANQITVTGTTTPVLSLPSVLQAPGTLAINGATIGSNALAVTGTAIISGNVGIGTTTPTVPLHLVQYDNSANVGTLFLDSYGTGANTVTSRTALGTSTSPSAITANSLLAAFAASGYTSSSAFSSRVVGIRYWAAENFTSTAQGTYMGFETTSIGSVVKTERVRIDSTGNVGIGTTTPTRQVQIYGSGQATAALTDAGNTGGTLMISDSGAAAGNGGALTFSASVSNGQMAQAAIKTLLQNGASNGASDLAFSTRNAPADTALTERVRISSAGCVEINMVTCGTGGVLNTTGKLFFTGLTASSGTPNSVCINSSTKEVTENGALTCTTSSRAFKTRIAPLAFSATNMLMALNPAQFAYRDQTDRLRWGFIAEEVSAVDKRFGDAFDKGGVPRSLDQNAILAVAVKTIQEQQVRIEKLEARVQ